VRYASLVRVILSTALCGLAATLSAQPNPLQMSGIPRPDPNLADEAITVRVIRGSFANNVTGHPVELRAGDDVSTTMTDGEGRATFTSPSPGVQVTVATTLDGARLVSQPFAAPGLGGVAVLLVGAAGDGDVGDAAADALPRVPARPGRVAFAQDSRILIELGEENVEVYYLLDVLNVEDSPVEPDTPFEFFLPAGAQGATILPGSSPRTLIDGPRVWESGGFAPGVTPVRVAYILPYSGGTLAFSQSFPADFAQLLVFTEKWGTIDVASTLIDRRGEMGADETGGAPMLWGAGGSVPAGRLVTLEMTGLPHHNAWPRIIALSLAGLIVAVSVWTSKGIGGHDPASRGGDTLQGRREHLFTELVKVERQQRLGKIGKTRYGTRRAELTEQLQSVLRDLDEGLSPDTAVSAPSTPAAMT
jgi:hypothetical protein